MASPAVPMEPLEVHRPRSASARTTRPTAMAAIAIEHVHTFLHREADMGCGPPRPSFFGWTCCGLDVRLVAS